MREWLEALKAGVPIAVAILAVLFVVDWPMPFLAGARMFAHCNPGPCLGAY